MGFELGISWEFPWEACYVSTAEVHYLSWRIPLGVESRVYALQPNETLFFFFREEGEVRVGGGLGLRVEVRGNREKLEYP